jgi:hypothetical protein
MCHHLIIRRSGTPDIAAAILLVIVFVASAYRAATQSMTIDEAFTYNLYLAKPVRELLTYYDANNHVLYTILAKISIAIFGNAEWAVRLPALLGAVLYFVAVYRLCQLLIASPWLRLLAVAVLTLNPYLLDFLSAARGYGLGIALMLWGVYWLLRSRTVDEEPNDLRRAGFAFGFAVASSLTLVFPIGAFAIAFWLSNRYWRVVDEVGIPMTVSAFVFLAVPLTHATKENFYAGTQTLRGTIESLTVSSFRHHPTPLIAWQDAVLTWQIWGVAAVAAVCALAAWWGSYAYRFLAASFVITILGIDAAHAFAGLKYPELRTGLYLIPLASLLVVAAVAALPSRAVRALLAIPLVFICTLYIGQWNTTTFTEWQWDQNSRTVAKLIRDREPRRVGASWELVEALNYYRDRFRIRNLEPLTRADPDGEFDMYALLPEHYSVIAKRKLREIYRDPKSQVVVAVPAGAP